jgi:hypothetical protein
MKKQLLFIISTVLLTVSFSNAQTKVWDFGNNLGGFWPTSTGIGNAEIVVDGLGLFPIATNTNFGAVNANVAAFPDGYSATQRFQLNGGGGGVLGNLLPIQRYLYFTVDGACTVTVWFKTGSNGTSRSVLCTNGTTLLGSGTANNGTNGDLVIFTANVSAADAAVGKIYIYGDTASSNLYKVEVSGANITTPSLSSQDFNADTVNIFANGKQVSVLNVKSDAKIEVFNMLGALVKSVNTSSDVNIDMETAGFYIVNVTSKEGKKSTKVSIK